jgi:IS5 family transposase
MKRKTIKKTDPGIFDYQNWVDKLAAEATPLDRLAEYVDFERFRHLLEAPLLHEARGPGGRPAFDAVFMYKVLILQRLHALSDDQCEFQIRDRFSFQRFLGISVADAMPDAKTIWKYREIWTQAGVIDQCFVAFREMLEENGVIESPGKIVDATFVEAPKQRNSKEDNEYIKENGKAPPEWNEDEAMARQKDVDARWAKKNEETHYGYKCHVIVSSLSKIIEGYKITAANVHDSQVFLELLNSDRDKVVYADSAYRSKEFEAELAEMGIESKICKKGTRVGPLSEKDKRYNTECSKIRCRVEHIFGMMTNSMDAMRIRCIGIARAAGIIGLNNIVYNMLRGEQISRLKLRVA